MLFPLVLATGAGALSGAAYARYVVPSHIWLNECRPLPGMVGGDETGFWKTMLETVVTIIVSILLFV